MLETFALRLAAGMLLALLLLPIQEVPPRFYRLQLLIALGLVSLAGVSGGQNESAAYWLGLGLAGACCFFGTWFWLGEANRLGLVPIGMGLVSIGVALATLPAGNYAVPAVFHASRFFGTWLAMEHASAVAQLGLVLTAMLLGHYYLITPGMSVRPLVRLTLWLLAAIAWRCAVAATDELAWRHGAGGQPVAVDQWLWLTLRWLGGVVAAATFTILAWRCARIRSTQSATGILYAAVISTFLGELAEVLLHSSSGP